MQHGGVMECSGGRAVAATSLPSSREPVPVTEPDPEPDPEAEAEAEPWLWFQSRSTS